MIALDILMLVYLSGITGSMISAAIFAFPKTLDDLDNRLTISLLWPLLIYHRYTNEINRRAHLLTKKSCRNLISVVEHQERLLALQSEKITIQNEKYRKLKDKYDLLEQQLKINQKLLKSNDGSDHE